MATFNTDMDKLFDGNAALKRAAKRNRDYWRERSEILEEALHSDVMRAYDNVAKGFTVAARELEGSIADWYMRFAKANATSLTEARKMLDAGELDALKWTVDEYITYAKEHGLDPAWISQLESASAKVHISRLEALQIDAQQALEKAYARELADTEAAVRSAYQNGYYGESFLIQKGLGVGFDVARIDPEKLDKIIHTPWTVDKRTFSQRIWDRRDKVVAETQQMLTRAAITGQNPVDLAAQMAKNMGVEQRYAKRLLQTEGAYFSAAGEKASYQECGITEYEFVATLDSRTSDICREMDGRVFKVTQYDPGLNAPPMHVNCRSTTCAYFKDEEELAERIAKTDDGGYERIPATMKYKEWRKRFVDGEKKKSFSSAKPSAMIKAEAQATITVLEKLHSSRMTESDYQDYLRILNSLENSDIRRLYAEYADRIDSVQLGKRGFYQPGTNELVFSYPKYDSMARFGTLAHEYGHFFDAKVQFDGLSFKEIEAVQKATDLERTFPKVASSSDDFLEAVRKDKEHLKGALTTEIRESLMKDNASVGVQDAIDGLFSKSRLRWGHGEKYYNRKYSDVDWLDRRSSRSRKKELQQVYKDLGFDASSQAKVKGICRIYDAASEMWANISSAAVCGGEELKYVKTFLPNSYQAFLDIIKRMKKA